VTQPAPIVRRPREDDDVFVGPLAVTVTADGTPVDDAAVSFAVLPHGQRPAVSDWQAPADNPDSGTGGVGVVLSAVSQAGLYGWWVKVTSSGAVEVLEPSDVAWVIRT
jgi:hypothetical protein